MTRSAQRTWLLVGVLGALAIAWFIYNSLRPDAGSSGAHAFAVADTAGVTRITLKRHFDKLPEEAPLVLTRKDGKWWVNDRFEASPRRVQDLLATLAQLHVREAVAPSAVSNAFKIIQSAHVAVQVEGSTDRSFFVGPAPPDKRGALAYLEGSRQPVVLELPGMQGTLAPHFPTQPADWQEYVLLKGDAETLRSVEVQYPGADSSFVLIRQANGIWKLKDAPTDTVRTQQYMEAYRTLYALSRAPQKDQGLYEQLAKRPPVATIRTTDAQGRVQVLVLHGAPADEPYLRYGWVLGKDELLLTQNHVIDRLLVHKAQLMARAKSR